MSAWMHSIIFHMGLHSVPFQFQRNNCTKLVSEHGEHKCSLAPLLGFCSSQIWATNCSPYSHWFSVPAMLADVGSALSAGKGHLPPPPVTLPSSRLELSSAQRCQPPDSVGNASTDVGNVNTDAPLDPGLALGSTAHHAPSQTCCWAKTHTHGFIFNSVLFIAASIL